MRDRLELLTRQVARGRNDVQEPAVDAVDLLGDDLAFGVGEPRLVGVHRRAAAFGDRLAIDEEQVEEPVGDELAAEDSDRARQGSRPGDDPRTRHGHVVAA